MEAVLTLVTVSRPETTLSVTRGAGRLMLDLGYAPVAEVGLPNGRRADLMCLGPRGEIAIVEVKSSPEDYLTDRKWGEYLPYCDRFYFAVAPHFPRDLLPEEPGLIVADGFGGAVLRESPHTQLVGARRKALTIAFGRLAAMRSAAW
jgi:hypothetical protein